MNCSPFITKYFSFNISILVLVASVPVLVKYNFSKKKYHHKSF